MRNYLSITGSSFCTYKVFIPLKRVYLNMKHTKANQRKKKYRERTGPGAPLDVTEDAQEELGDTTGLTGITKNYRQKTSDDASVDHPQLKTNQRSGELIESVDKVASGEENPETEKPERNDYGDNAIKHSTGNDTLDEKTQPHISGEQTVSGDMPDPESDDDVLKNEKDAGLHLDEDPEHPEKVTISDQIDKAEKEFREK